MRSPLSLRVILITTALVSMAGCELSVIPLSKAPDRQRTITPVEQYREPHHSTHYYRCRAGFKPLPADDRPKLGDVDVSDKVKLNIALAAYIQRLDRYISARQRKEEAAYRTWRSECDDFLN